jgi:hypothetical protein
VVRVPGYRPRGPGFDFPFYQLLRVVVGLKQSPFSLIRIIKEVLEEKIAASVYKTNTNRRGNPLH